MTVLQQAWVGMSQNPSRAFVFPPHLPLPTNTPISPTDRADYAFASMPAPKILWAVPPAQWKLKVNEVHVWVIDLDVLPARKQAMEALLSRDEVDRAQKYRFESDRNRFIVGRGCLRSILASYLVEIKPIQLRFDYGPQGKPGLLPPERQSPIHFSLAHSERLMIVAVAPNGPVGIDLERERHLENVEDLVETYFGSQVAHDFHLIPGQHRLKAFYNLWTRHEACCKASGQGIAEGGNIYGVTFHPGEKARTKAQNATPSWTLHELHPAENHLAALATPTSGTKLCCWRWPH